MRSARQVHPDVVVPVVAAALVVVSAVPRTLDLLTVVGAWASIGVAVAAVLVRGRSPLLAGQIVPISVGIAVFALADAGVSLDESGAGWRPALAVVAYPFLGRALLHLLARHRQIRKADVLVEAALVGTAVGIVLHVMVSGIGSRGAISILGDAEGAFPAMLVGLDVALLVIGARGLASGEARRGPFAWLYLGLLGLVTAHLIQQVEAPTGQLGLEVSLVAAAAMAALAIAVLHRSAGHDPQQPLEDRPLFSTGHAAVVGTALLAAPLAMAVQAIRGITPSSTVATGALLSGMILVGYLVQLLRDRATTEHHATHDGLTQLPNRTLLVDRLDRSIAHARRNGRSVGALFIDLDSFKEVNDTLGHAAGDTLLRTVAERLLGCVRDEDTVARLAGDEFVVLLPHLTQASEVLVVADRILAALGDPVPVLDERLLIAASVGVALYPDDGATAEDVLASADAAMYRAKATPGNHWEVFSPDLATEALTRMQLEASLLDGIARDELILHYQPIHDTQTGRIAGAEALVRWMHPERGLLLPVDFVPVAERSDLIVMLGDQVIMEACRELRRWKDLGFRDRFISVNVAARHFSRELVSTVTSALRVTGADPQRLVIELTESTIVDNLDAVAATLVELRELGVSAAIDDFGTGYCGLRYLSALPVAALKIDRSFIQGMTPSDAAIVGATIAMGHRLGLTIVAEGVETEDQRRFLAEQGCDRIQGFLLGRPVPAEDLLVLLQAERASEPRPVDEAARSLAMAAEPPELQAAAAAAMAAVPLAMPVVAAGGMPTRGPSVPEAPIPERVPA